MNQKRNYKYLLFFKNGMNITTIRENQNSSKLQEEQKAYQASYYQLIFRNTQFRTGHFRTVYF